MRREPASEHTKEFDWVTCHTHGRRPGGTICRHLNGATGKGFYGPAGEGDPALQAWCHACEQKVIAMGGWPDSRETVDNFQCVCDRCFERSRELNALRMIDGQYVH